MGWTGPIHLPSSCWSADSSALYPKKHTAADLMTRPQSQSLICVLRCSGTKYTNEQPSSCLHMMFVMAKLWLITKPHSGSDLAGHIPPGFSIITHMSVEASWYSRVQVRVSALVLPHHSDQSGVRTRWSTPLLPKHDLYVCSCRWVMTH